MKETIVANADTYQRYWLFAYDSYLKSGGLGDLKGRYVTEEAARVGADAIANVDIDYQHIVFIGADASIKPLVYRHGGLGNEWILYQTSELDNDFDWDGPQ